MARIFAIVKSLVVICAISILLGCSPQVVSVRPPEPRVEVYGSQPYEDAVWRAGHWAFKGGEWVWISGHWARPPRPHAYWISGQWEPREGGWVWVDGHWE